MKYIILCLCLLLIGCAGVRENLIRVSEEDVKNAEASRIIAINFLKSWPINSGFIRGALGERIITLPCNCVAGMGILDELAKKTSWTDEELGYSMGIRVQMLGELVWATLEKYAPDVLKYMPIAFGL